MVVRAKEGDSHMTDLSFTPAVELIKLYRGGKTSPLEVMQAILDGQPVGKAMQRSYLTYAFVLGLPAVSIPCGFTRAGLPVGLQIVAKRRGDAVVLRAAAAFEAAHNPGLTAVHRRSSARRS